MSKKEISPSPSSSLPLKSRLMMAIFSVASRISRRSDFTVNRTFMNFFETKVPPSSKSINGVSSFDIPVDPTRNLWFRLYIPSTTTTTTTTLPLLIYFHGGGFCFFSADSKEYDQYCRRLALEIPAAVISVNYRLAPEYKYPCQYDDGFDTLKFIDGMSFNHFSDPKLDFRRCFVAGDSAGGNVAHHVVLRAINYKFSQLNIIGVIAIQPFFGGEERTESEILVDGGSGLSVERADWYWKAFLPEGEDRNHQVVNVFGPNAVDMTTVDFPATLICIGGYDILQDWQKRYYEGLKKSGKEVYLVEYPKMIHGFYGISELPESSLLIHEMREFIKKISDN
ncbi:probable carboxylesterase 18 [Euphorbia lathyris]|uniref:probable carboxylesterase 18 n=1 Tax=Euphorbia lathyris TaxID=212925 RepID=UPI0033137683